MRKIKAYLKTFILINVAIVVIFGKFPYQISSYYCAKDVVMIYHNFKCTISLVLESSVLYFLLYIFTNISKKDIFYLLTFLIFAVNIFKWVNRGSITIYDSFWANILGVFVAYMVVTIISKKGIAF